MEELQNLILEAVGSHCYTIGYKFATHTPFETLVLCGFKKLEEVTVKDKGNGLSIMIVRYLGLTGKIHEVELRKGYYNG